MRDRFAVNPGIDPSIVAAVVRRPIHVYKVHPPVLAGTPVPDAVPVGPIQQPSIVLGYR